MKKTKKKEKVSFKKKAEIKDKKWDIEESLLEILPEGKYKEDIFEKYVEEGWPKGRKIMAERYIHKMWFWGWVIFYWDNINSSWIFYCNFQSRGW